MTGLLCVTPSTVDSEASLQRLLSALETALVPPPKGLWVACSGGLDSLTLLHLTARHCQDAGWAPPGVVHVNHGLSPHADRAEAEVRRVAASLGLPCHGVRVAVHAGASGLEAAARAARYEVFEALLGPGEALLLAHHEDDQAETVFLRLLRGAGLGGLGAMAPSRPLAAGRLLRPWLAEPRARLEAAAEHLALTPVEDPTNADLRFDRNFLRREIFPALAARWPGFPQRVAHSAAVLRRAAQAQALPGGAASEGAGSLALRALPVGLEARGDAVVHWLRHQGVQVPGRAQVLAFCAQLEAREDALPRLELGAGSLRRWRGALWLAPRLPAPDREGRPLALGRWPFPGGVLEVREVAAGEAPFALAPGAFHVRQGSLPGRLRLQPDPSRPRKTVKALLQEAAVPPWQRPYLPQLWAGDRFLGWPGVALALEDGGEGEASQTGGRRWALHWRFEALGEAKRVE